jgi:hypothetical protein
MRRILSKTHLIAMLVLACLAGQSLTAGLAWGAAAGTTSAPVNKAALNKAVQEALAKAQAGQGAGGAGTAGAAGAAGAGAAGGAAGGTGTQGFSELTKKAEEEEPTNTQTTATTSNASTSSPLKASLLIPIAIVAVGLLAGIAFLILRDARGVTPAGDLLGGRGNAEARAAQLRKRRAKAKAAKRQRKRNR